MAVQKEYRLAVGTSAGRRSTVWKFEVRKNDIYIFTRMFGSDAKVSLHETGACQWSATDIWVKKDAGRTNADRHFMKWLMPRPNGTASQHIFQVRIPETELRVIDAPKENLSKVQWLPAPTPGHSVSIECYITPISQDDPAVTAKLPHDHLFSLPLADGRWFVALHHTPPLDGKDMEPVRSEMNAKARAEDIEPKPEHRASAFTGVGDGVVHGLIELCTVAE